jgi:S-adenosylmethionine:tRNA ribosyltransferase-isomerase
MDIFDLKTYDYVLPVDLIANKSIEPRDQSRLLIVDLKERNFIADKYFANIENYLNDNCVIVRNNTKVYPARLVVTKVGSGAMIEMLFLRNVKNDKWEVMCKKAKKVRIGDEYCFFHKGLFYKWKVADVGKDGLRMIEVGMNKDNFLELLNQAGLMPLPPYIEKDVEIDYKNKYQTIYAKNIGSVAAPTAGFHFTESIDEKLQKKGVIFEEVTLHVGAGTFAPVRNDDIREHQMHSEFMEVDSAVIDRLNEYKKQGKKILSIGTTTTRFLESLANDAGKLDDQNNKSMATNLFVYPGFKFKFVDEMVTNFHLPKSTLLMLVSGFIYDKGNFEKEMDAVDFLKKIYARAMQEKFRFYSFGDAMWIRNQT